jgi:hypothetical protein
MVMLRGSLDMTDSADDNARRKILYALFFFNAFGVTFSGQFARHGHAHA